MALILGTEVKAWNWTNHEITASEPPLESLCYALGPVFVKPLLTLSVGSCLVYSSAGEEGGKERVESTSHSSFSWSRICPTELWNEKCSELFLVSETLQEKYPFLFGMFYTNHCPTKKSALPGGRAAEMAEFTLFRCEFPSAMPRMDKVLGWWLIFHAWKYHNFEIPFFASFWEAGKKGEKVPLHRREVLHFPGHTLCFKRTVKQSFDIPAVTQRYCTEPIYLGWKRLLKIIKSSCKSNLAQPTTKPHPKMPHLHSH